MSGFWRFLYEFLLGLGAKPAGAQGPTLTYVTAFGGPPQPPPGLDESRDLAHAHPLLRERFLKLQEAYELETGRRLFLTSVYRSPRRQAELFQVGRRGVLGERVVTNCDGTQKKSQHNYYPARAVDCAIDIDPGPGKVVTWNEADFDPLGLLGIKYGLVWGGFWTSFRDLPHLQLHDREGWA